MLQRLAEDRLHEVLPVAMVTAKGQPDLATRAFLGRLCAAAPRAPVLGLVDWNPAGACILATFKFGNPRLGMEGARWAAGAREVHASLAAVATSEGTWGAGSCPAEGLRACVCRFLDNKRGAPAEACGRGAKLPPVATLRGDAHPVWSPNPPFRYAVPALRWLGVTSAMLPDVPRTAFHTLTPRDASLLPGLRRRLAGHPGWLEELAEMEGQVLPSGVAWGRPGQGAGWQPIGACGVGTLLPTLFAAAAAL